MRCISSSRAARRLSGSDPQNRASSASSPLRTGSSASSRATSSDRVSPSRDIAPVTQGATFSSNSSRSAPNSASGTPYRSRPSGNGCATGRAPNAAKAGSPAMRVSSDATRLTALRSPSCVRFSRARRASKYALRTSDVTSGMAIPWSCAKMKKGPATAVRSSGYSAAWTARCRSRQGPVMSETSRLRAGTRTASTPARMSDLYVALLPMLSPSAAGVDRSKISTILRRSTTFVPASQFSRRTSQRSFLSTEARREVGQWAGGFVSRRAMRSP